MNEKAEIRSLYKIKRQELSNTERLDLETLIRNSLFNHFNFSNKFIHTFISIEKQLEVNTALINQTLFGLNSKIATSITLFNPLELTHSIITKETRYILDKFHIPTPTKKIDVALNQLDFVLVPLLAFDKKGNRIGYGKGLYDSFLAECNPNCIKIGLSYFEATTSTIQSEEHDIPLDFCVTPNKIYSF